MRVRSRNRYVGGRGTGFSLSSTLTISMAFANRAICQNSVVGAPFDLYFHSGFHFLLFSVRRTRSFSSRNKTHKGTALASKDLNLDFHAARAIERERERDCFVRFIQFSYGCYTTARRRALRSRGESLVGISRILSLARRPTIMEQTIRANNASRKRHVRASSAPSPLFLFQRCDKLDAAFANKIKMTRQQSFTCNFCFTILVLHLYICM